MKNSYIIGSIIALVIIYGLYTYFSNKGKPKASEGSAYNPSNCGGERISTMVSSNARETWLIVGDSNCTSPIYLDGKPGDPEQAKQIRCFTPTQLGLEIGDAVPDTMIISNSNLKPAQVWKFNMQSGLKYCYISPYYWIGVPAQG